MLRRSSFALPLVVLVLAGCSAHTEDPAADTAALTASTSSAAFIPYVALDVVAERVAAFRKRNGADWEPTSPGSERRFIASPGSMRSRTAAGPEKRLTREEARDVARAFFLENANLLSIDGDTMDATLEVERYSFGGGDRYRGWRAVWKTPAPPVPFFPDVHAASSDVSLLIDVDGVVRRLFDPPSRMPATAFETTARFEPLDAEMIKTFIGKRVVQTELRCDASTYQVIEVTHDRGTIDEADLSPSKVLRLLPNDGGAQVRVAYDYALLRFDWRYVVDATTAEVFFMDEPTRMPASLGPCW